MFLQNGQLKNANEIEIPLESPWLHFSQALFETLLVFQGEIQDLNLHLQRAQKTAMLFSSEALPLTTIQSELIQFTQNQHMQRLKIFFWFDKAWNYLAVLKDYKPPQKDFRLLIPASSYQYFSDFYVAHKTVQYQANQRLREQAQKQGYDDYLRLDQQGFVQESSYANIFFLKDDQIFTPKAGALLPGIIRQKIMAQYPVKEKNIHVEELANFSGAFLTNSLMGLKTVIEIERVSYLRNESRLKEIQERICFPY
jgi:4-amino-4-deoxychorismate lyase